MPLSPWAGRSFISAPEFSTLPWVNLTLIGAYVCLTFYQWHIPFVLALFFTLVVGFASGPPDRAPFSSAHGGGTCLERHHGHRGTLLLLQRRRGTALGYEYGCLQSSRLSDGTYFYRQDRYRSGLPVGFRRFDRPSHRLCLLL